jgi:hypothetical protein
MNSEKKINRRRRIELITPSWLSVIVALVVAIGLIVWVILSFELKKTGYTSILTHPGGIGASAHQPVLTLPGQNPPNSNTTSLQNTWPLIAFWGMIGLVAYFVVDLIISTLASFNHFNQELSYVHAKRDKLLRNAVELLIVRLADVAIWLFFIDDFFKKLIPKSINLSHHSLHAVNMVQSIEDVSLAFAIIFVAMHLHAIFLRIAFRRPRLFSRADYLDV